MEKFNIATATFRDFIRPLFRQKYIIIITCIIISIGVFIGLKFQTPMYEATVLIHIKGLGITEAATYGSLGSSRIHFTQMAIVKSNPVLKRSVKALNLDKRPPDYEINFCNPLKIIFIEFLASQEKKHIAELTPEEKEKYLVWKAMKSLKSNIYMNLQPNTDIFEISVHDFDPNMAVIMANVVSRSYTIYDLQQQLAELTLKYGDLHPTIQQLQDNITKMTNNLNGDEISDSDAIGTASVKIIEQASTDYIPVGKSKFLLMIFGILMSGFAGVGLAFIIDIMQSTFKSPLEFAQYLDIPAIGTIPKKKFKEDPLIINSELDSLYNEFYNDLGDQIFIFMKVQNLKTLLFVSAIPDNINSAITINLGYNLSHNLGLNTLVIDANVTNPSIQKLLNINEMKGFADILEDNDQKIEETIDTYKENLHIMQIGSISQNTAALLNESKIKPIIKKIRSQFDTVLVDCTYMKKLSDITMLASSVDGVILVVNEGKDLVQATKNVVHVLKQNKANIIGGILNNRTFPIPNWLYRRI
jgi:Mrp family chromosome partitioning ATPase